MKAVLSNYQVLKIDYDASILANGKNTIGLSIQTGLHTENKTGVQKLIIRFDIQYLCHENKANIFNAIVLTIFDVSPDSQIDLENDRIDDSIMQDAYEKVKERIESIFDITNVKLPQMPDYGELLRHNDACKLS